MNNNAKNPKRQTRILYISVVCVLIVLAVIIAVTSALNRGTKGEETQAPPLSEATTPATVAATNPVPQTEAIVPPAEHEVIAPETEPENVDVIAKPEDALPTFTPPVSGAVMAEFSDSVNVFSQTMNDYRTHMGVDLSAEAGENICAPADGTIGEIWEDPFWGVCMTINHNGGAISTLRNISNNIPAGIEPGAEVMSGQPVAVVGETALVEIADNYHVHYELAIGGAPVNPAEYMTFAPDGQMTDE